MALMCTAVRKEGIIRYSQKWHPGGAGVGGPLGGGFHQLNLIVAARWCKCVQPSGRREASGSLES